MNLDAVACVFAAGLSSKNWRRLSRFYQWREADYGNGICVEALYVAAPFHAGTGSVVIQCVHIKSPCVTTIKIELWALGNLY